MAYGVNLSALATYIDQVSFEVITQAVATAKIADYSTMKVGNSSGTVAINVLRNNLGASLATAGFNPTGSTSSYGQVNLPIDDIQVKVILSGYDYRAYYLSAFLDASGQLESVPNEKALQNLYEEQIRLLTEIICFYGDGATVLNPYGATSGSGSITGLIYDTTYGNPGSTSAGGSINLPSYTAGTQIGASAAAAIGCWTAGQAGSTAQSDAYNTVNAMYNSLPASVIAMDDLTLYCSIPMYMTYIQSLINRNYFHYDPGNNGAGTPVNEMKMTHFGTRITVVPFAGLGTSCRAILGPKKYVIYGLGLNSDIDFSKMYYDVFNDEVKYMAKWRVGFKIAFPEYFVTNNVA